MIAKITKGKKARPALAYDFGPGRRDEHKDARIVAGSVPGTWRQVGRLMDTHLKQRDLKQPIWRCSLSLPDEDGVLADTQFAAIAEEYIARMGFGACPWVAVRHGQDHIHLTVVRIGWDGRTVDDHGDFIKSMPIVRALEKKHRLVDASERSNRNAPQVSGQERAASVKRGAAEPERDLIRREVWAARDAAAGRGRPAFEAELARRGIDFKANEAKTTGRMNGYSFSVPAWLDADGQQVWITASKTARDLAWQKLRPVLEPPAETPAPTTAPGRTVEEERAADPAAQLLGTMRERAAREQTEALVDQLRRLPFGLLGDQELRSSVVTLTNTLDTREHTSAAEAATSMRLDGIASGVTTGPVRQRLLERHAALSQAVGYETEATAQTTAAAEQRKAAEAARKVATEATKRAAQRWRLPASKRTEEGMAKTALEFAERAEREAVRLDREAARVLAVAESLAPAGTGGTTYAAALEALDKGWKREDAAARAEDAKLARLRLIDHAPAAQAARVAVAQARQQLDQALAEQQRRTGLPADQAAAEHQVRDQVAAAIRARAAQGKSTTTSPRRTPPKKAGPAAGKQPPRPPQGYDPRDRGRGRGR
ncbi:relaxase/mobilization nuclease domain-containing protein [Kitasatospora sp. NPDC093550]|uniref:relaxase/mobilization nuclease domain-containing protein n=1 Tax=Kitasatospora sp. NPDC093550 TaxID=3364089 RepID=UPI00380E0646